MTTAAENERLGVLEIEVAHIKTDVGEIKSDVKSLIAAQNAVAVQLAAKNAAETAVSSSHATQGVWVRFVTERAIAIAALVAALISFLAK